MMYPFMQLEDGTEIVHSDIILNKNIECVKIYIEKPVYGGFYSATCYLPDYKWENVIGFTDKEVERIHKIIESTAHLIIRFAKGRGFENAANF